MLNKLKLKAIIVESGVSVEEIAEEIGKDRATIYRKMSGKTEFTCSELKKLKKILKMDFQTFCYVFFADELTETQEMKGV